MDAWKLNEMGDDICRRCNSAAYQHFNQLAYRQQRVVYAIELKRSVFGKMDELVHKNTYTRERETRMCKVAHDEYAVWSLTSSYFSQQDIRANST